MNRIPPDRSMPAVLLTDGPDTTATVHAHGWNITTTIDTARAARLAHSMTGSHRALIWHGRGWTISLPLPAPSASAQARPTAYRGRAPRRPASPAHATRTPHQPGISPPSSPSGPTHPHSNCP